MATIYLCHPRHGQKVACGDLEASMDRANGWVDYDPYGVYPFPPVALPEPPVVVEALVVVVSEDVPKDVPKDVITEAALPSFLAPPVEEVISNLPEDFPGRESLIAAGFLTWGSLVDKTDEELQEVKGIGPATAKAILEVMEG